MKKLLISIGVIISILLLSLPLQVSAAEKNITLEMNEGESKVLNYKDYANTKYENTLTNIKVSDNRITNVNPEKDQRTNIYTGKITIKANSYGNSTITLSVNNKARTYAAGTDTINIKVTVKQNKENQKNSLTESNNYQKEIEAMKGKAVPAQDANYSDVAKWVTAEYWYNNSKQLSKLAKTKNGQKKMQAWVKEMNKHIRGGSVLTKNSDASMITETNITYTARELLNDLIKAKGDDKKVDETTDKYEDTATNVKRTFNQALTTIAGETRSATNFNDVLSDVNTYDPGEITETGGIENIGSKILGGINIIGIVASVIILAILGIKFIIGSIDEKAEIKKSLPQYLIGLVLLVSITTIVNILYNLGQSLK